MTKFTLALAAAALLGSCGTNSNTYQISGTADSTLNGKQVLMYYNIPNGIDTIATTIIENGKFALEGSFESLPKTVYTVMIPGTISRTRLVNEPVQADVHFFAETFPQITVGKGELNKVLAEMSSTGIKLENDFVAFYQANQADGAAVMAEYQRKEEILSRMRDSVMNAHKDDMLGAYALMENIQKYTNLAQLDSVMALVALAKDFAPITDQRDRLLAVENTSAGKMFVDFSATTPEGEPAKLSDYVGKGQYVLVDFWASWCGPCTAELPYLRDAVAKFSDKGFVMLGVNVWDQKEAFEKSLKEKDMNWANIYASHDKTATDLYGVQGIPTLILFAPDGTIVNRTLRGQAIIDQLTEIYK